MAWSLPPTKDESGTVTHTEFNAVVSGITKHDGPVDANNQPITNLPAPSADNDAARKRYVDDGLAGKANSSHTHAISDITSLQDELDDKLESVGISDIDATGTPSSSTYLRGDGSWQTPAGGGGAIDIEHEGTPVGSADTLNIIPGSGISTILTDVGGGEVSVQISADTAAMQSKAAAQAGGVLLVEPESASGSAYTAGLAPPLSGYTEGMVLHLVPDVANTGACTLNIDTLGAKSIKLADGSTDPGSGDLAAGRMYPIWYDGTVFRIVQPASGGGGGDPAWGDITGSLSSQTDLQAVLDSKPDVITKTIVILDPLSTDDIGFVVPWDCTITKIKAVVSASGGVEFNAYYGSNRTSGTAITASEVVASSSTTGDSTTSFSNNTPSAEDYIWIDIEDVTPGTTRVEITFYLELR